MRCLLPWGLPDTPCLNVIALSVSADLFSVYANLCSVLQITIARTKWQSVGRQSAVLLAIEVRACNDACDGNSIFDRHARA